MKWENPPHGGEYKLVATKKFKNDIGLVVLCPDRREYSWRNVPDLHNEELKKYLLSLREGIEKGVYDLELLNKELDGR
ncbi:hypothetical protein [Virgibacillus litoralis]|uniref:Uncharacterized protein n=1 Tax=Virgibacillus litoralis TaxID=578221 RepID=A0ABS4HGJ8_9BACI|nr:hypothetical protein [Virgibacillus litoralis]MBP1950049.1 hypothetical protein [Virgibacillus litoralis]